MLDLQHIFNVVTAYKVSIKLALYAAFLEPDLVHDIAVLRS